MNDLLKVIIEALNYLPPELVHTGIILYLVWFSHTHKKDHREILSRLEKREDDDQDQVKKLEQIELLVLKSIITNKDIPESARLDAYDIYKKHGGNSWVDKFVEDNINHPKYNRRKEDGEQEQ